MTARDHEVAWKVTCNQRWEKEPRGSRGDHVQNKENGEKINDVTCFTHVQWRGIFRGLAANKYSKGPKWMGWLFRRMWDGAESRPGGEGRVHLWPGRVQLAEHIHGRDESKCRLCFAFYTFTAIWKGLCHEICDIFLNEKTPPGQKWFSEIFCFWVDIRVKPVSEKSLTTLTQCHAVVITPTQYQRGRNYADTVSQPFDHENWKVRRLYAEFITFRIFEISLSVQKICEIFVFWFF